MYGFKSSCEDFAAHVMSWNSTYISISPLILTGYFLLYIHKKKNSFLLQKQKNKKKKRKRFYSTNNPKNIDDEI